MSYGWLMVLGVLLAVITHVAVEFTKVRTQQGRARLLLRRLLRGGTVLVPIAFAVSWLQFPGTIAQFSGSDWLRRIGQQVLPTRPWGAALYFALVILSAYFSAHASTLLERRKETYLS
jgi:preprotein translocase subunit SecY